MTATFLVFLLCGQPVYVFLDAPEKATLYALGEMDSDKRKEFIDLMNTYIDAGRAQRMDFKVEDQAKGVTCGVST